MEKEKTVTMTIRMKESRKESIQEMADMMGVTPNKLASTMLEAGFVLADNLSSVAQDVTKQMEKDSDKILKRLDKEVSKNGKI